MWPHPSELGFHGVNKKLQPTIFTNNLYTPRWPSFLSQLCLFIFYMGSWFCQQKHAEKMHQQKHHQPKPNQKNHAGAMPAPSPRKRMSSLIPWILTRRFKGWVSFWESKVPFCPRFFSIAKRWIRFEFLATWKTKKNYEKTAACFFCSTFPFFVTPEPRGMETRTSTPSRRMTRFNSPISCQLP